MFTGMTTPELEQYAEGLAQAANACHKAAFRIVGILHDDNPVLYGKRALIQALLEDTRRHEKLTNLWRAAEEEIVRRTTKTD